MEVCLLLAWLCFWLAALGEVYYLEVDKLRRIKKPSRRASKNQKCFKSGGSAGHWDVHGGGGGGDGGGGGGADSGSAGLPV